MSRTPLMRLALAAVALVVAVGPGWAVDPSKAYPCWVRVHQGAQAFLPSDDRKMAPVPTIGPRKEADIDGSPILYVDTVSEGAPWIWRLREYAYHRRDVDLLGDCSHIRME